MNNWKKLSTAALATIVLASSAIAQDKKEKPSKDKEEKTQEIVIRKKPGKTEKMTIVVDGDNVTINGKPVDEFKNDDVTILKRDRSLAMAGPRMRGFDGGRPPFGGEDLLMHGNGNKAMLGIITQKADDGVKVTDVTKESGAEKAGLKKDDIITKIGTTAVATPQDLVEAISAYKPNDKVDITYKREGKENKTTAVLGENKSRPYSYNFNNKDFNFNMPEGAIPPMENFDFNFNHRPKIGLQIQDIEEGKGVKVKDVDEDSPASKAGIKEGDVITQVNGKDVAGVDELRTQIRDLKDGDVVKLTYKRDGKNQNAEIKIPKRLKSADL
ncbi:PDZ domain-containing protein [Segetibacter koreensis]|uniref:PDZ domain-containing protein n=1 Tax=Segetibacter koreensis TaxID=398037 RepID=UPI00036E9D35|nr:PDZ domain-containing protein [Segetibacter koreensis]